MYFWQTTIIPHKITSNEKYLASNIIALFLPDQWTTNPARVKSTRWEGNAGPILIWSLVSQPNNKKTVSNSEQTSI